MRLRLATLLLAALLAAGRCSAELAQISLSDEDVLQTVEFASETAGGGQAGAPETDVYEEECVALRCAGALREITPSVAQPCAG